MRYRLLPPRQTISVDWAAPDLIEETFYPWIQLVNATHSTLHEKNGLAPSASILAHADVPRSQVARAGCYQWWRYLAATTIGIVALALRPALSVTFTLML